LEGICRRRDRGIDLRPRCKRQLRELALRCWIGDRQAVLPLSIAELPRYKMLDCLPH
jgi:hypothetical protein